MQSRPFSVRLSEEELAKLDAERKAFGLTRTAYIRQVLNREWQRTDLKDLAASIDAVNRRLDALMQSGVRAAPTPEPEVDEKDQSAIAQSVESLLDF